MRSSSRRGSGAAPLTVTAVATTRRFSTRAGPVSGSAAAATGTASPPSSDSSSESGMSVMLGDTAVPVPVPGPHRPLGPVPVGSSAADHGSAPGPVAVSARSAPKLPPSVSRVMASSSPA